MDFWCVRRLIKWASLVAQMVKKKKKNNPASNAGDLGLDPWVGKIPLKKGMATHSSILAQRIP